MAGLDLNSPFTNTAGGSTVAPGSITNVDLANPLSSSNSFSGAYNGLNSSSSAALQGGTSNTAIGFDANGNAFQGNSTANFWYQPDSTGNSVNRKNIPYDINYAYTQQALKNNNGNLRMSLSIPNVASPSGKLVFRAHIDPNHLTNDQKKRIVKLNTITGVVLQDFGYEAEEIELRGTTGSAYYKEIAQLDAIFNNQSTQTNPAPVTLTIESRVYTCVWQGFMNQRQQTNQGGNLIEYTMQFIVLFRGTNSLDSSALYTSTVQNQNGAAFSSNTNTGGQAILENVSTGGLNCYDYVSGQIDIPKPSFQQALTFIAANWDPSLNGGKAYPGDLIGLNLNQYITVPTNWSDVL